MTQLVQFYKVENNDKNCPVCYKSLSNGRVVAHEGGEDHSFHEACVPKMIRTFEECALCKAQIDHPWKKRNIVRDLIVNATILAIVAVFVRFNLGEAWR